MSHQEVPALDINAQDREWVLNQACKQLQGAAILAAHGEWARVMELLVELRGFGRPAGIPSLSALAQEAWEACDQKNQEVAVSLLEKLEKKCASQRAKARRDHQ